MNKNLKHYLISSGITFLTGFVMVLLPQIDQIKLESLTDGALVGILFACVRAGVKALCEWFIALKLR